MLAASSSGSTSTGPDSRVSLTISWLAVEAKRRAHPIADVMLGQQREDFVEREPHVVDLVDRETCLGAERGGDHPNRRRVPGSQRHDHFEVIIVD